MQGKGQQPDSTPPDPMEGVMSENTTTEATEVAETGYNADRVTALHEGHAAYIKEHFGVDVDPAHVFLIYSTRNKYRATDAYRKDYVAANENAKVEQAQAREAEKAKKAAEREEAKKAADEAKAAKQAEREEARKAKEAEKAEKAAAKEKAAAEKAAAASAEGDGEQSTKATRRREKAEANDERASNAPF